MKQKIVVIQGDGQYFGTVEGCVIKGIGKLQDQKQTFIEYIKRREANELITIEVGEGQNLITKELLAEHQVEFEMLEKMYEVAKSKKDAWVINKVFDETLVKF